MIIKRRGVFPETLESETMNTHSIYNGLDYTTREINHNFKIKVAGMVNGKKVNTLVGVSGLIKIVGDIKLVNRLTEAQALQYCYDRGIYWEQNGVRLYEILDRVSCRICRNKNLKELQNIKQYLPETWAELMELQNRISQPFKPGRKNKKTGELIPGKTIHYFNELWDDLH